MRIRRQPKDAKPGKGPIARRSRHSQPAPPKAAMVVDTMEGRIVGWQRGNQFIPAGEPCCENPIACEREECWQPWSVRG